MFQIGKKLLVCIKTKLYKVPKNSIFPIGLTHAFGQKMPNFSLFRFGQNKARKSD